MLHSMLAACVGSFSWGTVGSFDLSCQVPLCVCPGIHRYVR